MFVGPLLEFPIPVWSPFQKGDIDLLESVQHRKGGKEEHDMIQLYKVINGMDKLEKNKNIAVQQNREVPALSIRKNHKASSP